MILSPIDVVFGYAPGRDRKSLFSQKIRILMGPVLMLKIVIFYKNNMLWRRFLGRTHFCTTNFGNVAIFRMGNLYSLYTPGNQDFQKIICFYFLIKKGRYKSRIFKKTASLGYFLFPKNVRQMACTLYLTVL